VIAFGPGSSVTSGVGQLFAMSVQLRFFLRLATQRKLLGLSGLLFGLLAVSASAETEAESIIARFVETQSAKAEMAFIRMQTLVDGVRQDERRFLAVYQELEDGSAGYLIRLVRPKDVQGVSILATTQADGTVEQSIFLPAVGTMRPLKSGAQAGAFLGSDFSYEDLLREVPGSQSYEVRPSVFLRGAQCHVVRATPRLPGGQYGFRDLHIDEESSRLMRIDYFGTDGKRVKQLDCFDYESPQIFGNSQRPHRTVMTNEAAGTSTIFTVIVGRMGEILAPETFTPEFIENWTEAEVEEFMFQLSFDLMGPTP
jgi:hypothetical protein